MESIFRYKAPPSPCGYLPDRNWSLEYEMVVNLSAAEYGERMMQGWRRFGATMFHPQCGVCRACQALRVDVARFRPNRSQRRALKANQGEIELVIGKPRVNRSNLQLYDRFHRFQTENKGWPDHPPKDASSYRDSFVDNPPFTEEWRYLHQGELVGVGYVDRLPVGLSAIYFVYEPTLRARSLGVWNVLQILADAKRTGLPHVYLGYYVEGCASLAYKANYRPNEILSCQGTWQTFHGVDESPDQNSAPPK